MPSLASQLINRCLRNRDGRRAWRRRRLSWPAAPALRAGVMGLAALLGAGRAGGAQAPAGLTEAVCDVLVDGHMACSGVFIDAQGTCLTCAHALIGAGTVELLLSCGRRVAAVRGGAQAGLDAAVLFAQLGDGPAVKHLSLASRVPREGERLFLGATALYRRGLVLTGHVARERTGFEYNPTLKTYVEVFYVHAMVPRGVSGGPWVDARGDLVGLQSGSMYDGGAFSGVAFVVPGMLLKTLAARPQASPPEGDLGAACDALWEHSALVIGRFAPAVREGLVLCRVLEGGACDRAGLSNNDCIVAVDGVPCRFRDTLLRAVRGKRPGSELVLDVVSPDGGATRRRTVRLDLGSAADAAFLPLR